MAELQQRGIPFVVDDDGLVHQLGPSRRRREGQPVQRLIIREGDATTKPLPGARQVAVVQGLTAAEKAELARTRQEVGERLREMGEVPLDADGAHVLQRTGSEPIRRRVETMDVDAMLAARSVTFLVEQDLLDLTPSDRRLFRRYTDLQRRWDLRTVALYLAPDDQPEVAS